MCFTGTTDFFYFILFFFPCSRHLHFYFSSAQSEWELKGDPLQLLHFGRGWTPAVLLLRFSLTNTYEAMAGKQLKKKLRREPRRKISVSNETFHYMVCPTYPYILCFLTLSLLIHPCWVSTAGTCYGEVPSFSTTSNATSFFSIKDKNKCLSFLFNGFHARKKGSTI